jgi:hypothetical protein
LVQLDHTYDAYGKWILFDIELIGDKFGLVCGTDYLVWFQINFSFMYDLVQFWGGSQTIGGLRQARLLDSSARI